MKHYIYLRDKIQIAMKVLFTLSQRIHLEVHLMKFASYPNLPISHRGFCTQVHLSAKSLNQSVEYPPSTFRVLRQNPRIKV